MQSAVPLACFLSMIRPPGVQFENSLLQIAPVDKAKCPFVRNENDIGFRLYTRHNPTVYQELAIDDDEKLFASNIDYHSPTVIYFHAFMENPDDGSAAAVREAYVLRGDTNIIMVDASRLEAGPWYFTAAENTWYIGRFAAQFVDYLVSRGLDLSKTHFVGHSLGAQAAGVAGGSLKSGRVARITGLDPALPLFHGLPEQQRLDQSDADFVDVIHTDAGIFGFNEPVGHADFYPNGGISPQPGCELEVVIPQHLLLNKCDPHTHLGYYTYHLTPHRFTKHTQRLTKKLQKLFTFIHASKGVENKPVKVGKKGGVLVYETDSIDDDTKTTKTENVSFKKSEINKAVLEETTAKPNVSFEKSKINNAFFKEASAKVSNIKEHTDTIQDQEMVESVQNYHKSKLDFPNGNTEVLKDTKLEKNFNVRNPRVHEAMDAKIQEIIEKELQHQREEFSKHQDSNQKNDANTKDFNENAYQKQTDDKTKETESNLDSEQKQIQEAKDFETKRLKRTKRFISLFKRTEAAEQDNFLFKMLEFLLKNRKNIVPVYSVMREINTLVKSGNGELNHVSKERNNYIGAPPPILTPVTYSLELANENRAIAFVKRLLGLAPKGDRLTINGSGK